MPEPVSIRDSILNSIRKQIGGVDDTYTHFDEDLIMGINTYLRVLNQIGVGKEGFKISGSEETWEDFLNGSDDLDEVVSYMYLQVKLLFDPPSSGTLIESMKSIKDELEWRLNVQVDYE